MDKRNDGLSRLGVCRSRIFPNGDFSGFGAEMGKAQPYPSDLSLVPCTTFHLEFYAFVTSVQLLSFLFCDDGLWLFVISRTANGPNLSYEYGSEYILRKRGRLWLGSRTRPRSCPPKHYVILHGT